MADEYLDTVNENNELTGKKELRSKIHSEGIWHRTVHIYLFRRQVDRIEFLVHLRSPLKDLNPNKWDTRFGGHIKSGVTLAEAVEAEIKEEVGLNVSQQRLYEGEWYKRNKFPNCEFSKVYFLEFTDDVNVLKFNDGEVQEVKWATEEKIKDSLARDPQDWSTSLQGFAEIADYLKRLRF